MVCRLIEGFESTTTAADLNGKWTVYTAPNILSAAGRYGNGARFSSTHGLEKSGVTHATWIVGLAVRPTVMSGSFVRLADAGTVQAGLSLDADGSVWVWRSSTSTILGRSAAGVVTLNTWQYVEFKCTIGNTGSAVVRVNGVEVLNLPSVDTMQTTTASAGQVLFGVTSTGGMTADVDDIYIFDGSGSTNTDFIGDCRVERLLPSGAGATTAWTPSAGANYACVDEAPPNADTDYVATVTAGATDTYAFGDLVTSSGTVFAVQATAIARKDDAGSRSLALVARPGSTDRVGATLGVGDTYASFAQTWDVNPDTSGAWTLAAVNGSSFGVRLIA